LQKNRYRDIAAYGAPVFAYMYTVGSVGFWLPLYAKINGFSYFEVQMLATVYFLIIAPSTLFAGWLSDKSGRPGKLAFTGMILNAISVAVMPSIMKPAPLMADRILQALGLSTAAPIALGALSLALGVSRGVGSGAFIMASGMATGSIIGGVLIEYMGYNWLFYSASIVSLVAGVLALTTNFPRVRGERNLRTALSKVPLSAWIVLLGLLGRNTMATGVYAILSILFNKIIGLSILETALALSLNPIFQAVFSVPISKIAKGRELEMYSAGIAMTSLVFTLYYYSKSIELVLIAQAIQGITYSTINVSGNMYVISVAPREIRYTASSLYSLFFNIGWIIGTVIAGLFMNKYGPIAWLKAAIIILPVIGLMTYVLASSIRKNERNN